ncbi:MAG: 3'-5' exonuclease domain-containing protein 2 [Cyclobacteriaceae bacterium]
MFASSIPKEEVKKLPLIRFEGNIHMIDTLEKLDEIIPILQNEKALGFDTETKPTFTKGAYNHTALIQFSTLTDAYLIRINLIGMPDNLVSLLEDPAVTKIGISIRDDLKELRAIRRYESQGFVDLNNLAKDLGITQIGMRSLTGIFLASRISKNQQTSNWENEVMTTGQQYYAATDAWVCLKMYLMLKEKGAI